MASDTTFGVMSDLCIEAGAAVMKHGSSELQSAMRVLLMILGQEIASQMDEASPRNPAVETKPDLRRRPMH